MFTYVLRSSDDGSDGFSDFRVERIGVNAVKIDVGCNVKTRHFLTVNTNARFLMPLSLFQESEENNKRKDQERIYMELGAVEEKISHGHLNIYN